METYGERRTQHLLDTFICNRGKDEYDFLIKKAIAMEKKDLCRTYLAVNDTALLGFFTVGIKCTKVPKTPNLSKSFLSKIGINPKNDVVQCYLLAQLCRSDVSDKGFGTELIGEAFRVLSEAKRIVGCRAVRLDCKDDLIGYYTKSGFVFVRKNEDGDLNQMLTVL